MDRLTKPEDKEWRTSLIKMAHSECSDACSIYGCCEECPIQKAFDKLAEYEDAEEAGRLIKLPVAIGTKIWWICPTRYPEFKGKVQEIYEGKFDYEWIKDIGEFNKTWFLSREEAEKALEETP